MSTGAPEPGYDARRRLTALEAEVQRLGEALSLVLRLLEGHAARSAPGACSERVPLADAAKRLGVGKSTLRRWVASGRIPGIAIQVGARRRWSVERSGLEQLEYGATGAPERKAAG